MKVGFITPINEKILMNYDEVENFCKGLCFLDENYENFEEFSKDYSYFHPYFDFVMAKLNYIFINPLLNEKTYLKCVGKNMYSVQTELEDYQYIVELAKQKKFSEYDPEISLASDKNLNINCILSQDKIDTWLVDPNGYSMIFKNSEGYTNHEITANIIVNQVLMSQPGLDLSFSSNNYSLTYLIENFGFLRTTYYDDFGIVIGFDRLLSDTLTEYKNKILSNSKIIYQELETEYKNLNNINKVEQLAKIYKPIEYNFNKYKQEDIERRI